jgi:hypothetical protein
MSHTVEIQTEVRDLTALQAACRRNSLPPAAQGTHQLFAGPQTGWRVNLPGWQYPVVADLETGKLAYDNFGGRWGESSHLDRFL